MFGIFKAIFSRDDTSNKIVDGIINGTDALFFTDEEKSVANQKILDWKLKFAEATKGSNVARRFISLMITFIWCLWVLSILGAIILSGWFNTIPVLQLLLADFHVISASQVVILTWYFGKDVFVNRKK